MAIYGARDLRWAKMTAGGKAGASFPTYDAPVSLGPLVSVADSITYAIAENYGDDALQEHVSEFQRIDVTTSMTEMPIDTAVAVYASTKNARDGVSYNADDSSPDGCMSFYASKLTKGEDGVLRKYFQGVRSSLGLLFRIIVSLLNKGQKLPP